jgi:hypothetical protein
VARKKRNWPELNCDLSSRLEINMGKTLTKLGGLGAKAGGRLAVEKEMANRGDGKTCTY